MTGYDIVRQARQYLGVPYYHCGRDRNGLDCAGLLIRVAHDLKITEWDELGYSQQIDVNHLNRCISMFCDYVGENQEQILTGDVLLISMKGNLQHLGIATGSGIIHSIEGLGVVEHSIDGIWSRRIKKIFRLKDIKNG